MRQYAKTLSLSNSRTLVCDSLYLNRDGQLQDIDDLSQSSSINDIAFSNLTDTSINNIVLSSLCYASISYPRITLGAINTEYNANSTHTCKINGSSVFFANSSDTQFSTNIVTTSNIITSGNIVPTNLNGIAIAD